MYILILITLAIPFIAFIILSGCAVTGARDGGGAAGFPGGLPIERVSVNDDGLQSNGDSYMTSVSTDGRYVAFYSPATNLVSGDTNGVFDIFVYDRTNGTIERVSASGTGEGGDGASYNPALSADGRYVAFGSDSTNLVSADANGSCDIFAAPGGSDGYH
ncbi:MAG TPA: hypothetical protein VMZ05_07225 [Spirochaetota bacterium]|nr:hypothetical protein [Spirochaetota bacterium]